MQDLIDAVLYLGPQELRLKEQLPADIALDSDYRTELLRRESLTGFPGARTETLKEADRRIVNSAEDPLFGVNPPDLKAMAQNCLDRKSHGSASPNTAQQIIESVPSCQFHNQRLCPQSLYLGKVPPKQGCPT
jgi:hypothetical protein